MALNWEEAYRLLKEYPGTNRDYLEQIFSHAPAALAVFGLQAFLGLAREILEDPVRAEIEDPSRQKAFRYAGYLLVSREHGVPLKVIPPVRKRVVDAVAGPYLVAA